MRIEVRDSRPPVSSERLQEAAKAVAALGHPIPASYRAFLAEQDGGDPVRDCFIFRQGDEEVGDFVQMFLGIEDSPEGNLVDEVRTRYGRIPKGTFPIAGDPVGNVLLLDGRDGNDGPVWLWDHERETDPPDDSNLYWVAPDLDTLFAQLTEAPEPPPKPEQPKGWRRLFSRGRAARSRSRWNPGTCPTAHAPGSDRPGPSSPAASWDRTRPRC